MSSTHPGIKSDILLATNLSTYKIYVLRVSNTSASLYWETESISKYQLNNNTNGSVSAASVLVGSDVAPWAPLKLCLRGALGVSCLHARSRLGFARFGISCRERTRFDSGAASFEVSAFEKDQQLSRNFSRKWNFLPRRGKKCTGYVFRTNIIRYCGYSFASLADSYRLHKEGSDPDFFKFIYILKERER